jgi:hypothetical protein
MATQTPCQTDGAVFGIEVTPSTVSVIVELPHDLCLDEDSEALLVANLHNVVELALAPHWPKSKSTP